MGLSYLEAQLTEETLGAQRLKLVRVWREKQRAAASAGPGRELPVPSRQHDEWFRLSKEEELAKARLDAFHASMPLMKNTADAPLCARTVNFLLPKTCPACSPQDHAFGG